MGKKLGSIIFERRKALKLTLQQIATAVGVTYPAVQQWEKGKTNPGVQNIPRLANTLGMQSRDLFEALQEEDPDVGEIIYPPSPEEAERRNREVEQSTREYENSVRDRKEKPRALPNVVDFVRTYFDENKEPNARFFNELAPSRKDESPHHLPILGIAVAGIDDDGDFYFNGSVSDYIERPSGLIYTKKAYCIYVISDSMIPKFEANDLLFVDAERPAVANDYVVVELHANPDGTAGAAYVKRLKRRTAEQLILEQFHPPRELVLQLSDVKNVHRIIPWREVVGV